MHNQNPQKLDISQVSVDITMLSTDDVMSGYNYDTLVIIII